jgi:hypothetical protein
MVIVAKHACGGHGDARGGVGAGTPVNTVAAAPAAVIALY